MPGLDLGTGALNTALQGGLGLQEIQAKKQEANQEALKNSEKLLQDMAAKQQEANLDMVTITPQIAAGLKKTTGDDSWDRAVGTKWKSNVFTAIVAAQSQAKYHNDLFGNKELLEQMRDQAKEKETDTTSKSREKVAETGAKSRTDAAKITADSKRTGLGGRSGSSTKDLQASKAVLHNAELRRKTLADVLSDDSAKKEAQDWLTSHAKDIKSAEDFQSSQVPGSPASAPPPAAAPSTGTDKTIPLPNSNLPGLE